MERKKKRRFLGMLLGTLRASLLGNMLTGKGVSRAGYGNKEGKRILRAGYGSEKNFHTTPFFNKLKIQNNYQN